MKKEPREEHWALQTLEVEKEKQPKCLGNTARSKRYTSRLCPGGQKNKVLHDAGHRQLCNEYC